MCACICAIATSSQASTSNEQDLHVLVILLLVLACIFFLVLPLHGLTPLFSLLCVGGGNGNGPHHILFHCCVFLQMNKPFSSLLNIFMLLLFHLVCVFFLVLPPLISCSYLSFLTYRKR